MLYLTLAMLVCLLVAGGVVLYVAYPHRGEKVPGVPWLGDALGKAASGAPTLEEDELEFMRRG